MTSDKSKYNSTSKSKEWFPFKKRIFNCDKNPIINSNDKCSFKAETLLSFQEQQMLDGVISSLQANKRDAIRISINELHRSRPSVSQESIRCCLSSSKEKGHTSRSKRLSVRIAKGDLLRLEEIAEINNLTNKEALRFTIIWVAKGIQDESIKGLKGCKEISQDEKANEWKKNQSTFKTSDSRKRLKEVRDFWKGYFERVNEQRKQDIKYSNEEYVSRAMGLDTFDSLIEERMEKIIEDNQLIDGDLDDRNQTIYYYMAKYELEYREAVLWYEDEMQEQKKLTNLSPYELVQYLKQEQEETKRFNQQMEKDREEKRAHEPNYITQYIANNNSKTI